MSLPVSACAPCIDMAPSMTIAQAAEFQRTVTASLASGGRVLLDGSRVEQIDTSILQVLVCLWQRAAKQGVECRWQGASATLRRAAALIGVADVLMLDSR